MTEKQHIPPRVRAALEAAAKVILEEGVQFKPSVFAFGKVLVDAAIEKADKQRPNYKQDDKYWSYGLKSQAGKMLGIDRDWVRRVARRDI